MLLIKNGKRVYTLAKETYIENADVLVEGSKIVKVGKDINIDEAEVIDATGKYVYPGFIDAHCHLGMWEDSIGFEGNDGNETTNPITSELRAIDGINPMDRTFRDALKGGVTTVATGPGSANVIGGSFIAIKTHGHRVDDMIVKDVIGMKCAFGENPKRVYKGKNQSPVTRMAIASKLRETMYKAKDYLRKKENAEDESKIPEYNLQMEQLIPVLKKEIPLKAHAHRADDIFTAIRIAKEFDVKLTLDHCTEGHLIAADLAKEGYSTIVGPTFGDRPKFELKNKSFDTPKVLSDLGVKFAIMTDAPVIPLEHLNLCASFAAKAGLDSCEAIKAITINPAEILEIDKKVGSLEAGKDADVVIWSGDALDLSQSVECTIVNGEVVYKA